MGWVGWDGGLSGVATFHLQVSTNQSRREQPRSRTTSAGFVTRNLVLCFTGQKWIQLGNVTQEERERERDPDPVCF